MARWRQIGGTVLVCALAAAPAAPAAPADAQGLDPQLQEIRTLLREKRYPLALESLRLVARQIQDLRLESVATAFPAAPPGWAALPPLSLLEEEEIWSDRIVAQRAYLAAQGPSRIDITIDVHSPFGPTVALGFNPLILSADEGARLVPIGSEQGLLRFNPDTGEGELRVLVERDIVVTVRGRGLPVPDLMSALARRIDYPLLRHLPAGR